MIGLNFLEIQEFVRVHAMDDNVVLFCIDPFFVGTYENLLINSDGI